MEVGGTIIKNSTGTLQCIYAKLWMWLHQVQNTLRRAINEHTKVLMAAPNRSQLHIKWKLIVKVIVNVCVFKIQVLQGDTGESLFLTLLYK